MPDIMSITSKNLKCVTTSHDFPPIPIRSMDWSAVVTEYFDPEYNDPVGRGKTEKEAVLDLLRLTMDDAVFPPAFINALEGYLVLAMEDMPKDRQYGFRRCITEIMGILE